MQQSLESFGKNTVKVRSKDASVHASYPTLTSSSRVCGSRSLNRTPLMEEQISQATYRLRSWGQGPMPGQFATVCAASMKSIRVYLGLTLNPRHAVIMANFQRSFREVVEISRVSETPKAHILTVHVPQFIAYMDPPLGFTNKRSGGSTTRVLRCVVPEVSHQ